MVSFGYLFHDSQRTPITDAYKIKEAIIGTGKFSIVKEGVEIATNKPCAMKIMKKSVVQDNNLVKEVEIMRQLKHPNIISLIEIYETDVDLILVLELVTGGELFDKIVERVSYTEEDAAKLVKQIASVLVYLHSKDIVHCDLKPENLLYSDTSNDAIIKLCDFGLSQMQVANIPLTSILGTPTYMAPEIRACVGYGKAIDMWSLGVIVYILLCGFPPFDETTGYALEFPSPEWDNISDSARDLIKNLLVVDTTKRYNVNQTISHLWVSGATAGKQSIAGALKTMRLFNTVRKTATTYRDPSSRTSVFNLFPEEATKEAMEEEKYPAADSPAFFTIHKPEFRESISLPSSPTHRARGGSPEDGGSLRGMIKALRDENSKDGSQGGSMGKDDLAREIGLILQAHPEFLRTLSTDVGGAGPGATQTETSTSSSAHTMLEELMASLATGGELSGSEGMGLLRPVSGHFNLRMQQLEDQLRDATNELEAERALRRDAELRAARAEEANSRIVEQVLHAREDAWRLEMYRNQGEDDTAEVAAVMKSLVNTLNNVNVNVGIGAEHHSSMKDTIEGLQEENATLDRLYRQTKAALDSLKQDLGQGTDSLRKKNLQLSKELETLHKEHETLLNNSKSGGDEGSYQDEEKNSTRRKSRGGSFFKKIIG